MGSTQGVNASSNPATRNTPMVRRKLPEASVRAMSSSGGDAADGAVAAAFAVADTAAGSTTDADAGG